MKGIISKCLGIAVGVAIIYALIVLVPKAVTFNHPKVEDQKTAEASKPTVSPQEFNQTVDLKIRQALLDYYQVAEFPDILYQDSENLLGYLVDVTAVDPNVANGEFTLHFSNSWTSTSQTKAKQTAKNAMKIIAPRVGEVNAIWARFDTYKGIEYYDERVGREEVDDG